VAALATSPVDLIKTRVMNQIAGPNNKLIYRNSYECLVKTVGKEGLLGLYKVCLFYLHYCLYVGVFSKLDPNWTTHNCYFRCK
jgi:hypothetical protein